MSCREQIDAALADAPATIIRQADLDRRQRAVERLAALPEDCSSALEALAEEYVTDLSATSERLTVVLDAMVERGQDVTGIAARALTAPGFAEREPYVEMLEEFAPESAAGPLQEAFDSFDEDSDADGFLRARILRALGEIQATGAVGTVARAWRTGRASSSPPSTRSRRSTRAKTRPRSSNAWRATTTRRSWPPPPSCWRTGTTRQPCRRSRRSPRATGRSATRKCATPPLMH